MAALSRWVVYDEYMRHIDLSYNKIGTESMSTFLSKLKSNNNLVSLEMRGNPGFTESSQK